MRVAQTVVIETTHQLLKENSSSRVISQPFIFVWMCFDVDAGEILTASFHTFSHLQTEQQTSGSDHYLKALDLEWHRGSVQS